MKVERLRPTEMRITSASRDIAALISAARWVAAGCPGQLPHEAVDQLRRVLTAYDSAETVGPHPNRAPANRRHRKDPT